MPLPPCLPLCPFICPPSWSPFWAALGCRCRLVSQARLPSWSPFWAALGCRCRLVPLHLSSNLVSALCCRCRLVSQACSLEMLSGVYAGIITIEIPWCPDFHFLSSGKSQLEDGEGVQESEEERPAQGLGVRSLIQTFFPQAFFANVESLLRQDCGFLRNCFGWRDNWKALTLVSSSYKMVSQARDHQESRRNPQKSTLCQMCPKEATTLVAKRAHRGLHFPLGARGAQGIPEFTLSCIRSMEIDCVWRLSNRSYRMFGE